ncbi:class I adenylate-forming enzyme family protein [Sphingomonas tabacisoli]|uniref:Class I adenylate-forming enzyme family protein n=1 Tax=Sphingomonas tabacisoli TaxID=2249466 RepID=A0ABW4I5H5_9SPHN
MSVAAEASAPSPATSRLVTDGRMSVARGAPISEEPALGALTFPGFLDEVCARYSEREALVEHRPDGTVLRWTYTELREQSLNVARALVGAGLGKGERVGILMSNRAEFLSTVFGVAMAGGVAAPLSTFSTAAELEYLLQASACTILLGEARVLKKDYAALLSGIDPAIAQGEVGAIVSETLPYLRHVALLDLASAHGAIESWQDFLRRGERVPPRQIAARSGQVMPADTAVLFFSSGSTAKPKGILSAHRGVTIQMWRMARLQDLATDTRYWSANGFFWSGNYALALGATLAAGGCLVLQRTFDPVEALDLIERERATFMFAWPHQWAQLIEAPNWASADLSSLVQIDHRSPIAAHPTVASTYVEMRNCFGNTETFTLVTGFPANTPDETTRGSHGPPLPGNVIKIVDPLSGATMPLGERGEVAVKGPTLMLGYLGVPLADTLDEEGFLRTGDGGYLDQDGLLFWEGRLNDIIKTGGANVSPLEIDETIRRHPAVRRSQTVGIPHDTLGELVVTCIVPRDGELLDEDGVRAFAREHLASYKVPRRVLILTEDDVELTGTDKIKTAELRQLATRLLANQH